MTIINNVNRVVLELTVHGFVIDRSEKELFSLESVCWFIQHHPTKHVITSENAIVNVYHRSIGKKLIHVNYSL